MTKAEWIWVGRYVLLIGGSFFAGWVMHDSTHPAPTYAFQQDDCKYAGKVATGWTVSRAYRGGINNGGATAAIEYECQ